MPSPNAKALEHEASLLGCAMTDAEAADGVGAVAPGHFTDQRHQRIHAAIARVHARGDTVSLVTVSDEVQGVPTDYILALTDTIGENWTYYAQQVIADSKRRRGLLLLEGVENTLRDGQSRRNVDDVLAELVSGAVDISDDAPLAGGLLPEFGVVLHELATEFDRFESGGGDGVPTGIPVVDEVTQGAHPGDFVVIGSRPSMGKTALATGMALHMVQRAEARVLYFSLEMSRTALAMRIVSAASGVPMATMRTGLMTVGMRKRVHAAMTDLHESAGPLFICDDPSISLERLRTRVRAAVRRQGVSVVFVDYLQLLTVGAGADRPRHEQVSEISRTLKMLAREVDVPLFALSQLTRASDNRQPRLADLRESGSIEQDADVVLLLHREQDMIGMPSSEATLAVAKNRQGALSHSILSFDGSSVTFKQTERA